AQDDNGHGTHVAGIIGAMIDNIDGIAGIVPKPKLMILKVLDANGKQTDSNKVKEALSYALTNKAKIINMSFGGIGDWLVNINGTANQQFKAVWDTVVDSDVLLVAAAGNHGGDGAHSEDCVLYPAKYEEVLAVGGTDRDNRRWKDESPDNDGSTDSAAPGYNPWKGLKFQSAYGEKVGIAAPAGVDGPEDIYSTILDGEYGYMPGTSMAAAFVSGVAGLLLTANPYLNRDDLITIIQDNADEIDTGEVGKPIGKLINAEKAVAAALELMPAEDEIVIRGKVKNGEGEPQENIAVKMQLKNGAGEKVGEIEESELTDADGNYEIVLYTSAAASAGTLGVSALSTGTTYSVDLKAPIERDDFLTGLTPGAIYRGSENDINTSSSGGGPGGGPGDGDGPSCTFDRECAAKQPQGSIGKCIGDQCEFKTAADWNTYCQGGCGEWNNYSGEKCSDGTLHWTRWCRAGCADENDDTSRCNNTAPLADPYTQKQNNVGCETDQQCISGACYADYGERKTCHAEHKATGQRCTTDSACGRGGYCYAGSGGPETTCHTEPKNCTITGQSYSNGACRCPTGQHTENGGCVNNPASPASPTCTGNTYDSHGICCEKNTEENIGGACTAKCGTGQHRVGGECVDGDGIPDGCQGFTGDALQNCKDYCARHPTTDAERCADKVTGTTAPPCANRKARLATTGACPADDPAPPVTPPPATTTPPAGAPPAGSPAATPTPTPAAAPCNSSMCNTSLLDATEAEYNAADEAYLAAEARVNQEEDIGNNIMEINAAREAWQAALDALLEAKKAYEDAGGRI
ncbi:MAG: S8 family serine peptidase, partial [Candidatus Omnitrophica bacterium]|nr:S8 family serine peptidase [Candidatus Omnitrophota bacterium]